MSSEPQIIRRTLKVGMSTFVSRVLGLIREIVSARCFGTSWMMDMFVLAFRFPNLFRRLFGEGAMAPVFVPTFTKTLETEGREPAWRLLARTLALLTVTLAVVIAAVLAIIAGLWFFFPPAPERVASRELLLALTALMLPFMLSICVLALLSAILNCVGSFVPAALAPIILNVGMIAGIAWAAPRLYAEPARQVYVVALSVLVAGVLQLVFILPALRANGVTLGWRWEPADPTVKRMLRLLAPVALGQGVLTFGVFLDAQVCTMLSHVKDTPETVSVLGWTFRYPLTEGALSAVTYAQRLYQFPLGVLVISLATAALPAFSRSAVRQDWPAWTADVRQTLRLAIFEGLLAGVMMIMLAEPITRLLFERGRFTAEHTGRTAYVLIWYGFGLWAFCAQHIVLRAFYSLGDVRTPLVISALLLPVNAALNVWLLWIEGIREAGFAIGSAITFAISVLAGLVLLRRRIGTRLLDGTTVTALVRMVAAAAATALVLWGISKWQPTLFTQAGAGVARRAAETLGLLAAGSAVFLAAAWAMRLPEVGLLLPGRFRRKVRHEPRVPDPHRSV